MAKGNISVSSENIFPIIKKWLYSDKDIFLRELVSNGCDAVTKLKKLAGIGEAKVPANESYRVDVIINKEAKTLTIKDNGIGMTAEEIDKYITQIAFSGANDFLEKYKDEENKDGGIIGHFGLGFYSAFMPSESVEIDSLSYREGAKPAKWFCDGSMEYDLTEGTRQERGTTITLHIAEDSEEFLEEFTVRQILNKYCSFLPVEIYLEVEGKEDDGKEENQEPKPLNDTAPLWVKAPKDCTDEEYKAFYTKVFMDFNEPLFWIHLNVDFPFNLKGILYFPKLNHEFATNEGQIKLYNNQVFVADNVKEVIPEFLMLLKGVIDCPDLPLNVSRSFLQNDGYVKKVSAHIIKKVCDKLTGMFNAERETLEKYWDDISPFVKYGSMRDESFYEKVKDIVMLRTTKGEYKTVAEYLEGADEKHKNIIYYATNADVQAQYIDMYEQDGVEVVTFPLAIDTHFMSFCEFKNRDIRFKRVDSEITSGAETDKDVAEKLTKLFKDSIGDDKLIVECRDLKTTDLPAIINMSEEARRLNEMSVLMGGNMPEIPDEKKLIINTGCAITSSILASEDEEYNKLVCNYIYDLASLAHAPLTSEQMKAFIDRSAKILERIR